jgi:hypothetical protein
MADLITTAIPFLALAVSAGSLAVAVLAYRRAGASERVIAWVELTTTSQADWYLATIHVKNPSRLQINLTKLLVELPDFRIADYESVLNDDGAGNRFLPDKFEPKELCIGMPCSTRGNIAIKPDDAASIPFLLYQPSFSRRKHVKIGIMWQTMESNPKFKTLWTKTRTRSDF